MNRCVCVYPDKKNDHSIKDYLHLAKKYHMNEVFTSVHLPEFTMSEQLHFLQQVAEAAKKEELELTVDIGGPFIKQALENESFMNLLKNTNIAYLRMDYGYSFDQLQKLYHALNLKGFVINASMYTKQQVQQHLKFFYSLDANIQIKACHNFYVREESGLDQDFALSQSSIFDEFNIPVYYCVPSYDHPRGPLYLGLPTIEAHRWMPLDFVLMDLTCSYHARNLMFSDEWISEKTFQLIDEVLVNKKIKIPVILKENITEMEMRIILRKHIFRYDSNKNFLRSRSSREMAEYASVLEAKNTFGRPKGSITIDNERYLRYSGELQVVMQDADADSRVNVSASLKNINDLQKLSFFREGYSYTFYIE